uniref:Serine carboxypeptidase-like 45 n=1 Tax=Chenopodium quinoa TaxID=63459 RepID=A0A803L1G5_CHEQI
MSFLPTMVMRMLLVLQLLILGIGNGVIIIESTDKITRLPGQPSVEFQHYSGYVTITDDQDEINQKALFYYFVEAEIDPLTKPLVLWLNGGPGCSSLGVGAFSENGPFRPTGNRLVTNQYSWNKEANMLYLETPAGVGFSYSTNLSFYQTANDHITGHYVPQLAELMLQYNKDRLFNLKGIALGNPVLEFTTDFNSRAEFFWSHGLISDSTYNVFTSACNYSRYVGEYYRGFVSPMCSKVMSLVSRETSRFVDKYDVTLDVCLPSIFSQSKFLTPHQDGETIDVCVEDETLKYLNRQNVQKAMHARLVGVNSWTVCSKILDYELLDLEQPTIHILGDLIKAGIPVLIYSGDQDSVIPLTGSRTLVKRLADELKLNTTVPYRVWFVGMQVGGWTEVHGDVLSFATIRGASHEAPFSQPERSLVLFKSFLEGKPLPEVF